MSDSQTTMEQRSDLAFRICFCLIFIIAGIGHFVEQAEMIRRLELSPWYGLATSVASPALLMNITGVTLVAGGVALIAGFQTRIAAIVLMATLIPITVSIHVAPDHMGPLLKNIAIFGGLIHFAVRGPGAYSIDNR